MQFLTQLNLQCDLVFLPLFIDPFIFLTQKHIIYITIFDIWPADPCCEMNGNVTNEMLIYAKMKLRNGLVPENTHVGQWIL